MQAQLRERRSKKSRAASEDFEVDNQPRPSGKLEKAILPASLRETGVISSEVEVDPQPSLRDKLEQVELPTSLGETGVISSEMEVNKQPRLRDKLNKAKLPASLKEKGVLSSEKEVVIQPGVKRKLAKATLPASSQEEEIGVFSQEKEEYQMPRQTGKRINQGKDLPAQTWEKAPSRRRIREEAEEHSSDASSDTSDSDSNSKSQVALGNHGDDFLARFGELTMSQADHLMHLPTELLDRLYSEVTPDIRQEIEALTVREYFQTLLARPSDPEIRVLHRGLFLDQKNSEGFIWFDLMALNWDDEDESEYRWRRLRYGKPDFGQYGALSYRYDQYLRIWDAERSQVVGIGREEGVWEWRKSDKEQLNDLIRELNGEAYQRRPFWKDLDSNPRFRAMELLPPLWLSAQVWTNMQRLDTLSYSQLCERSTKAPSRIDLVEMDPEDADDWWSAEEPTPWKRMIQQVFDCGDRDWKEVWHPIEAHRGPRWVYQCLRLNPSSYRESFSTFSGNTEFSAVDTETRRALEYPRTHDDLNRPRYTTFRFSSQGYDARFRAMLPLNLQDAKGSQREQVIWYWANLFGVVTRLKPGDIEWESFLMDTTRSLDFRDPGYLTYPDPHSDQNYKSWQPYQRQLEEVITLNDKQWTLPRERSTKKELETQKREKGSAFGAIRESLYYLNIALNRFLVLGYGLAPVDLSHFNTRVAVFRMTPWQFWERILGPRVQFTSPFRVKGPPAAYQSNAAAVLLYYSLLWDMHKETHPAVANALEEPPISIQEMYQLCYESISMAHHEEAQMRIGYKERIGGENIPAGRWSAFLWRMHIEDMKLSLGETKAPLVPFRRGETTDWPFAADRYDLRITIQGLRTPAFDRFSTAWKPNPPNIGSGQKARVLQTEQHFDQYENGGWNSPHAASDTEPQEEEQVTPPAIKEAPNRNSGKQTTSFGNRRL